MSDPRIPSAEQEANVRKLADYPLPTSPPFDEESVEIFALIQKYLVAAIAWADAERDRANTAERELKQWREWDDADDEWSASTDEAFPTRSGSHEAYATAMAMVSHRQSKGNLVELVNWLLVRIAAAETREREAVARAERAEEELERSHEYHLSDLADAKTKARATAYAEVVALCRDDGESDDTDDGFLPYGDKWADRLEELGKKGAE